MATKRQRRKRRRRTAGTAPVADGRPAQPSAVAVDGAQRAASARPRGANAPPPAPWGSFPLSELVVLVGIILVVTGFFVSPPQGFYMLAVGLVLGSLAGLELSIREHFSGYRSHSLLLAGAIGVAVLAGLLISQVVPSVVAVGVSGIIYGASAWLFASAFRRRSGGALYRFKGG